MDLIVFFAVGVVVGICAMTVVLRRADSKPEGKSARFIALIK